MRTPLAIIIYVMGLPAIAWCQDHAAVHEMPALWADKLLKQVHQTADVVQHKLDVQTARYLQRMMRLEQRLQRKLQSKDSATAHRLFGNTAEQYQQLQQAANIGEHNTVYIPFADSLTTSLRFLQIHPGSLADVKGMPDKINAGIKDMRLLEGHLKDAEAIKTALRQRQQYLQDQLEGLGFVKELRQLNKQVYYYNQQLNEYKDLLSHPDKMERKALDLLNRSKIFQDFMRRNSQLASMFRLPGNDDNVFAGSGLQTRAQVTNLLQQQLASGGPGAMQAFQQQVQVAQGELSKLQNKLLNAANGEGLPTKDHAASFKANAQRTKSFTQRLEYSSNLQSQKATNYFPVTTDLGLSVGYRLNDKSVIGLGASYKVGWGENWNHINITHQGAGLRSFVDWKMKGSFWLSGGFEMNYRTGLNTAMEMPIADGTRLSVQGWQQSGLIGLSKKYQLNKKVKGQMQLLWDLLSYRQLPRTQPIVFRVGYAWQ